MMPFINEAVDTFLQKLDNISKTGEIVDLHRLVLRVREVNIYTGYLSAI